MFGGQLISSKFQTQLVSAENENESEKERKKERELIESV